ncbi:MAG: TrbC/VirB2 family protein [Lachnospiraceae bacterium]|jgi:type IV secretory pathway VirB2 component (pilin)|nr:TrbC/VirB2 family protein [Lachnospiraceae bacterium]
MKTKTVKKVLVFAITLLLIATMVTPVFANSLLDPSSIKANATNASNTVQSAAGSILGIVQVVAIAVAVIMLIVLAIKYISSAPNDKAEIKKHAVIYVVGAILLFGASGILELIKQFSTDAFNVGP